MYTYTGNLEAFMSYDRNGDGLITEDEYELVLQTMDEEIFTKPVKTVTWYYADKNRKQRHHIHVYGLYM